jgi:hypothetical protein
MTRHLIALCGLGLILLVAAAVTAALWLLVRLGL